MYDDPRTVRRALTQEDPTQWVPAVSSVLEAVAGRDVRELNRVQAEAGPTVECPPLTRHRRGALRHDWVAEELVHVETCPRCQRTQETVVLALWHPEVGMLAKSLSGRGGDGEDSVLERHLTNDGCQSCRRLLASPWLHELAGRLRNEQPESGPQDAVPGQLATGFAALPRAVGEFAIGTRPPFHLRAVASRGDLIVTLRETDQGQLVVHVEAPRCNGRQTVRVELLGEGEPLIADVELTEVEDEPGCSGHHTFGSFVELVPTLRPAVGLLAVLTQEGPS